jgi:hypothetical protein
MQCCPKEPARKISRSIHESARDVARALAGTQGAQFEFTLAAIAQNLRRLAKFLARPPPQAEACVA